MRMHPYTYLCLAARLSQLALSKDDIYAHPLRPMSYWFLKTKSKLKVGQKNLTKRNVVYTILQLTHHRNLKILVLAHIIP